MSGENRAIVLGITSSGRPVSSTAASYVPVGRFSGGSAITTQSAVLP